MLYPSPTTRPRTPTPKRRRLWWGLPVLAALAQPVHAAEKPAEPNAAAKTSAETPAPGKQVIGATAIVSEVSTGVGFPARIDTGAKTCSMHVEEVVIEDPHKKMRKNLGKKVRVRVQDPQGEDHWIETKIAETVRVKTSEEEERRYKVWMTLRYGDVQKRVHVTLNDRSHMNYPLLVGRNFLRDHFLVDVSEAPKIADLTKP